MKKDWIITPKNGLSLMVRASASISFDSHKVNLESHKNPKKITLNEEVILAMDTVSTKLGKKSQDFSLKQGLHKYTLFVSGEHQGSTKEDTKKALILAYNDVISPTRQKAATKIQNFWRIHRKQTEPLKKEPDIKTPIHSPQKK